MLYQRSQESVVVRSNHHPLLDPRDKSQDDEENGESCDGVGCSQQLCLPALLQSVMGRCHANEAGLDREE